MAKRRLISVRTVLLDPYEQRVQLLSEGGLQSDGPWAGTGPPLWCKLAALNAQEFMAKWGPRGPAYDLNERQGAQPRFIGWLEHLKNFRVLDPACGSGNFLYLALKCRKDIEHRCHLEAAALGLDRQADLVTGPHNVLGSELNEYAAELARVTVWIGELQWRLAHRYDFKTNPVLEPLNHIECRGALLSFPVVADKWGSDPDSAKRNSGSDPYLPGYAHKPNSTGCALISTKSIVQGEQVGVLWGWLLAQGMHIHFAHRTFN